MSTVMLAGTGLEYWRDAAGDEIAAEAVERLTDDPRYDEVLRRAVLGALAFCDAEPEINATFHDIGTSGLGMLALYLDAKGGITHRRLAELSNTSTILSKGRASAILGLLRFKGLATPEKDTPRGAQLRYVPSANLPRFFVRRLGIDFEALTLIEPSLRPLLDMWETPGTLPRFISVFGTEVVRAGRKPVPDLECISAIGEWRAGFHILYDLLARADRGGAFPSLAPFEINISETARRFSVARVQVRRVIGKLEDSGFLTRDRDTFQFQPVLQSKLRRFIATVYVSFMACAHDVLQPPVIK